MAMFAVWSLEFSRYFTKKRTINRKAGDLTNLIQGCEDALTKAGVIEDDSLIIEMHAKKIPSLDGKNRISVQLFPVESIHNKTTNKKSENQRNGKVDNP